MKADEGRGLLSAASGERKGSAVHQLGNRVRERRRGNKITIATLAERTGFSASYISQLERGLLNPTVAALMKIAEALGTTVADFFNSMEAGGRQEIVVRANRRKRLVYPGSLIENELLSPDLKGHFEFLWVHAPKDTDSGPQSFRHSGEEAALVLKGELELSVGDEVYLLKKGDSIQFPSTVPHRWRNRGQGGLIAIWVMSPPSF